MNSEVLKAAMEKTLQRKMKRYLEWSQFKMWLAARQGYTELTKHDIPKRFSVRFAEIYTPILAKEGICVELYITRNNYDQDQISFSWEN